MSKYHGKEGVVKVGSPASLVAEVQSWNMSSSANLVEGSSKGDGYTTNLPGIKSQSGTIEVLYDPADTDGQEVLVEGAEVDLELYPVDVQSGSSYFGGKARISDVEVGSPKDGMVSRTIQFVNSDGDGITKQTVA